MFKKVQLKFFGIIVAILLAVFIAILGSINLIMDALMERQSKTVLKQIAAGVEYDDVTSTFTFIRDENDPFEREGEVPPPKPEIRNETTENNTTEQKMQETEVQQDTPNETVIEEKSDDAPSYKEETNSSDKNDETTENVTEKPSDTTSSPSTPNEQEQQTEPPKQENNENNNKPEYGNKPYDQWKPDNGWNNNPWDGGGYNPDKWNGWDNRDDKNETPQWGGWFGYGDSWYSIESNEPKVPLESYEQSSDIEQTYHSVDELYGGIVRLSETKTPENNTVVKVKNESGRKTVGREPVPKSLGSIDFFIVMSDKDGKYLATLNNEELSEENAQLFINAIEGRELTSGMLNNYQFYSADKDNGKLFVFTDKTAEIDMLNKLRRTTILIGIISIIVISAAAYFLSGFIVKPIKEAFEKQKQFISDASHELKTPLTVISANADVLSGEIGYNKWLDYIQDQTTRMNVLVNQLLNLTRLENNTSQFIRTDFSLSKAIENTALPFECQAFEMSRNFVLDIEEDVKINASEQHIKQMTAIFIDNALKYSDEGGTVKVTLSKEGDKKILSVYNTGSGIKEYEKDRIFERFYRSDESRNRSSGSYGLGLAIAKSIIDKHKYRIAIDNEEGRYVCFNVIMQ